MAEEKTISGEEYRAMSSRGKQPGKQVNLPANSVGLVIGAIVIAIIGFAGGVQYQKHHTSASAAASTSAFGGAGGAGARIRNGGGFGQVTAVSSSSITIQNARTGANQTFSIGGSTAITDNGSTVTTSDIQVGSTVIIRVASSGSTAATTILVNPSYGGGGPGGAGGGAASGSSGSSSSTSTQ